MERVICTNFLVERSAADLRSYVMASMARATTDVESTMVSGK